MYVKIKMDMPEICTDCPLVHFTGNLLCPITFSTMEWSDGQDRRMDDCPIVGVIEDE